MKSLTHKVTRAALVAPLFALMLGIVPQLSAAAENKQLSHKEVNQLIVNAKEPQDHLRLAQYYTAEADNLEVVARSHETMRDSYGKSQWVKSQSSPTQTVTHCDVFIESLRKAESADRALAAEHDQMAKDAKEEKR